MALAKRPQLPHLLPLLPFLLLVMTGAAEAQEEESKSRALRQYMADINPAFSSDKQLPPLPPSIPLQDCQEKPEIPNARVRCSYSGCRVSCNKDYVTTTGAATTTLSCDHSTGVLTLDGAPWNDQNLTCRPYCGVDNCLNGGTCIEPRVCQCPVGYTGKNCEIKADSYFAKASTEPSSDSDACAEPNFPVHNAEVLREGQMLVVRCSQGHVFKMGRTIAFVQCKNGLWDHPEGVFGDGGELACQETKCSPACLNGGVCLPEGVCDCPYKFWGGYCQHQRCGYPDPATLGPASLGGVLARMKIQCHPRHRMLDGRRTLTILCRGGSWYVSGRGFLNDHDFKCYPNDNMPVRPSP